MSSTQPGRGLGVKDVEWVKPPPPEDLRRAALRLVAWAIEDGCLPGEIRDLLEMVGALPYETNTTSEERRQERNRARQRRERATGGPGGPQGSSPSPSEGAT